MTTSGALARTLCLATLVCGFVLTVRAPAATPAPSGLETLQPGLWDVSTDRGAPRAMCLIDPASLAQVRHTGSTCSRTVIADGRNGAVVHYSCPGAGWGRTALHVETPRSVRIETQGIADGAPFAFTAQARRTGDCGGVQHAAFR